ncbi:hypothetical protein SKUL_63 [Pseudomonas phage Skulduggery]|uniref:Uncharacterized protein n=1 Tax=Pseudomonas phage Skulduggery TaxID=2006671 RepID=A0A1Y0SUH9_9CAUD|nr:hypothetical protein PP627_gp63 [Pseudomonas phage Skulduggery]ARV77162.1 hypothetical protein SKUL_63 [Pseudomonas phage Skulduggery]
MSSVKPIYAISAETLAQLSIYVEQLGAVARAAHYALEDGYELRSGRNVIEAKQAAELSNALDVLDLNPELDDNYVRDGWLRTLEQLRQIIVGVGSKPKGLEPTADQIRMALESMQLGAFPPGELNIYAYHSKERGGFDTSPPDGIAVKHGPTGIEGRSHLHRTQHANRQEAFTQLRLKLAEAAGAKLAILSVFEQPTVMTRVDFCPAIPPGPGKYDGSDNGVD